MEKNGRGDAVRGSASLNGHHDSDASEGGRNGAPDPDALRAVVLGGGVAGLYAGFVLSRRGATVTVIEKQAVVGGLAAGRERNGNFYDMGVHHLHAFDQEIFADIQGLMGARLRPVRKVAKVRYGRGYRRYPLQFVDMLLGIPPWTLATCVAGLVGQMMRNRLRPIEPRNAAEALVQLYGAPLYRQFFRDFTREYWGMPAEHLSATFVRTKMPRLSAVDVLRQAVAHLGVGDRRGSAVESALREETLWYSPTGSREMPMSLAKAIEDAGGRVVTEAEVTRLDVDDGRVVGVGYRHAGESVDVAADICLSTIPLPALIRSLGPTVPEPVVAAARHLRYKPIAVFGLLVRKPRVLDALYVYFRERAFHRIAEPRRSGLEVAPEGHTLLLVETTCEVGDDFWNGDDAAMDRIYADLEAEGLLQRDEVVECHVLRTAHGYPIFRLGFEPHLDTVMRYLGGLSNLRSTGRQGAFCYPNMHGAMRMGASAAEELLAQPSTSPATVGEAILA